MPNITIFHSLTSLMVILGLVAFSGCADQKAPEGESAADSSSDMGEEHSTEEKAEELSAEDLALIEEQMFCPVGGKLGGMGTPVKVMVEGKPVFICCEHCREPLLQDSEKYLAELEEKKKKAAAEKSEATPAETTPDPGNAS